jgi:rhamnosyltransferase subunit B
MFAAYDPLTSPEAPFISSPGSWGRAFNRLLLAMGGIKIGPAMAAIRQTYRDFGVTPDLRFVVVNPDLLTLGLYSPLLGQRQPDHPTRLAITGFPFYDSADGRTPVLDTGLRDFLSKREAPLVFSLGSAAVFDGERYFRTAIRAAGELEKRAVILSGSDSPLLNENFGTGVHVVAYAPHSLLFPDAAVSIHHGGIGSVGQALMAGLPQLVTPVFSDQFDNARRIQQLGVGITLNASGWTQSSAVSRIGALLKSERILAGRGKPLWS